MIIFAKYFDLIIYKYLQFKILFLFYKKMLLDQKACKFNTRFLMNFLIAVQ